MPRIDVRTCSIALMLSLSLFVLDREYEGMTDKKSKAWINSGAYHEPPQ